MANVSITENSVSAEWLHDHLTAENLIIFDASIPKVVGNASELSSKQIPNARFFDIKKQFSDTQAPFPNTIPSAQAFETASRSLGVNQNSAIVIYDDLGLYSSPRAWWLFKTFGFNNVAVLNGGMPAWLLKKYRTESKTVKHVNGKGDFKAVYNPNNVVYFKSLETISKDANYKIIDARSSDRFNCVVAEPRKGLRSGIIPNSVNLPYNQVLDGNILKSKNQLESIFKELAEDKQHLVFTCGSGITASILSLAATIANYSNSVYDGSWTEYGSLTTKQWSKEELVAYILLYIANSDLHETNDEKDFIMSKVDRITFANIHAEFDNDNDYQCLQKMIKGVEANNYSKDDFNALFTDIKLMLYADGEAVDMEEATFMYLRKILK
ncbi:sulfurtransferase [uncultured Lacinutrix sp.]|uniref:sulfurtransferase n=1 Tax=uncultured Lacinutrix sp. TaxID=574032 RepID=UPI0026325F26|nr:sulfurtransferase [uncultured Lacinutrix sp.]